MDVIKVPYLHVAGTLPNACFINVETLIETYGGEAVYGWRVTDLGPITECVHHSVWRDPDGDLWDISPSIKVTEYDEIGELIVPEEIDYVIDSTATPLGQRGTRTCRPSKYLANKPDNRAIKACEYLERSEDAVARGDWDRSKYWDKKANDLLHKLGVHVNSAPDILVNSW